MPHGQSWRGGWFFLMHDFLLTTKYAGTFVIVQQPQLLSMESIVTGLPS